MARMIPDVDPATIKVDSERVLYSHLREGLPKKYMVFHSYPWLRLWRGDRDKALVEGEADFLVVHPKHGVLVLEAKGGEVDFQGGQWVRRTKFGVKHIKDPFEQARRNMHAILDIVRDYSGGNLTRDQYVHGYAVAFPHLEYRGRLPANTTRALVICQQNLGDIQNVIERAFAEWRADASVLSPVQYEKLLSCLMPKFQFFRPLGPEIDSAAERIMLLTDTQAEIAGSLSENVTRVLVEGPAGSGKTELALRSAIDSAKSGSRTLFVCYNRELATWLEERVERECGSVEGLEFFNFHRLAHKLVTSAGLPFNPNQNGPGKSQTFWDTDVPELMGQAVGILESLNNNPRYDAIVVDEGQDFLELWWYTLEEDLLVSEESILQVFLDKQQSLWEGAGRPSMSFEQELCLPINCRNTRRVATFSADLADLKVQLFRHAPEGIEIQITRASTQDDQRKLVVQRIGRLLENGLKPNQVVLIGPATKRNGSLASQGAISGIPLVTSPSEWRAGNGILVTTSRSFKGLESPAVVLYDIGSLGPLFTDADLYVACTRPVSILEVIVHDDEMRSRMYKANQNTG
jgi:hypothetical protein